MISTLLTVSLALPQTRTPAPVREPVPVLTLQALEAAAPAIRAPREVLLSELREAPSRYAGETVRCAVHVAEQGAPFQPFLSRFDPERHLRVAAWSDEQPVWHREAYDDPAPFLFVERASPLGQRLAAARPHERFLLTVTVREVWFDEPWIEIEGAHPLLPGLGEGTVLHAARAHELWEAGQRELALGELERALRSPLPPVAHDLLLAEHAELERRMRVETEPPPPRPLPAGNYATYRLHLGPQHLPRR